ncbi:MAG: class II fructose-bisphosphatase [Zetaproteobacteria bacterium]|nr:class II fructose-bisphosphatase [Zetaproteobacteria bacterium]
MDKNFALEFVRVTEASAISAARLMGRGSERDADRAAVEAMRRAFDRIDFHGVVKIGEGERDQAPMLFIGEEVGNQRGPRLDIAVDPLEGTTITAKGGPNALSVIAVAEENNFLHAPDVYMDKIAVGREAAGKIDLDASVSCNLSQIAKAKKCSIGDLTVVILDRPRHAELIEDVRAAGARIWMIDDGDVQAAIACALPDTGVDVLMGMGGAPEGVIAAAAMKCLDGDFQGRLLFKDERERKRAMSMGIQDLDKCYMRDDLAQGNVMFCATGVTKGSMLDGVRFSCGKARTHSMVMRSETKTLRFIDAYHELTSKPGFVHSAV